MANTRPPAVMVDLKQCLNFGILRKAVALSPIMIALSVFGCGQPKPIKQVAKVAAAVHKPVYAAKLLQSEFANGVGSLPGTVAWKPESETDVVYSAATRIFPKELIFKRPTPNGLIEAVAVYDGVGAELPIDLEGSDCNDGGSLRHGCLVEIALHDFDGGGVPEIIVAIGDTLTSLDVNIIKYHPPGSAADAGRNENWELVGKFDGQSAAIISKTALLLPYGSQGLFTQYTWLQNKFVQSN